MKHTPHCERITTALLFAAGTGSRLYPLTENAPKCLTIVNGMSIRERLLSNLNRHGFKRLVVVTGHLQHHIRRFLGDRVRNIKIDYIFSIYSISLNSWRGIIKKLDKRISEGKVSRYYETIFAEMIADGSLSFECVSFDDNPWYEIDTHEDLAIAEKLFAPDDYMVTKAVVPSQATVLNIGLNNVAIPTEATGVLNAPQ